MHTKNLGFVVVRKAVYVLYNLAMAFMCGHIVNSTWRVFVFGGGGDWVVVKDLQGIHQKDSINVISDSSTVVNLAGHEFNAVPGNLIIFFKEIFQHRHRG